MRETPIHEGNSVLFLYFEMDGGADGAMTRHPFPDMLTDVVRLQ